MNSEKKKWTFFYVILMLPSKQTPFGICFSSSADGVVNLFLDGIMG
jgi:hypothetical protein